MMRYILSLVALTTSAFAQAAPSIANVTNAALPSMDLPPSSISLAPRSMATIWGTNLADTTVSSVSPWSSFLGGTEVHLAADTCFDSSCDLVASLIYVSPTQINFLVPDNESTSCKNCTPTPYRIVLVRDGQRVDNRSYILGGPGRLIIDPFDIADYNVVFQVGYDCLFSYSLSDPASCGLSWSQGQHRAPLGAVTDALSAQLISSQVPVHQGQLITLWMTALYGGVTLNDKTGLLQQASPASVGFGVAQLGKDMVATIGSAFNGPFGTFMSPTPIWAGESPQFVGLDQVNVAFPTCANAPATAEKRYDAFLTYTSIGTSTTVRIYLPFIVRPGDPDCRWTLNTRTTITSSVNPSVSGQAVTFTAIVSPSAATGTVTLFDGSILLGSEVLSNGIATFTTSTLSAGGHSIVATYNGDTNYGGSSTTRTQTVKASTTTTVTSSANPSVSGKSVTFTATVSPSTATGTVIFTESSLLYGSSTIGSGTLSGGMATCFPPSTNLGAGNHSITATYNGDSNYGGSSGTLTQVVKLNTTTTLSSSLNPATFGQSVTFTATVSPCCIATGTVTFFDGSSTLGAGTLLALNGIMQATFSASSLSVGNHSITASYGGDSNDNGSTSTILTQVERPNTSTTITSSPNPSVMGQSVTFTAAVTPSTATGTVTFFNGSSALITNLPMSGGKATFSVPNLSAGTHSITVVYSGDSNFGGSTSAVLTQTVNAH
jgi:hypothetical protein